MGSAVSQVDTPFFLKEFHGAKERGWQIALEGFSLLVSHVFSMLNPPLDILLN